MVLYECKSITQAAQKCFVSQSAFSLRIQALEDEIGAPLFVRGKGKRFVEPTEHGKNFYELSVKYQQVLRKMKNFSSSGTEDKLRVCCFDSVNHYIFRSVYDAFIKENPASMLEMQDMTTETSYLSLLRGETDLVFMPGQMTGTEVHVKSLFTEKMVFLCAKGSAYPPVVGLKDLSTLNEVFIEWSTDYFRWHRHMFGEDAPFGYRLTLTYQADLFLKQKDRWLIAPKTMAAVFLKDPDIETREISFEIPDRITNCLYRASDRENPLIQSFMKGVRKEMARLAAKGIIEITEETE